MSQHPLRPLDAAEVQASVALLKTLPTFTASSTRIVSIMLREPAKEVVLKWSENKCANGNTATAVPVVPFPVKEIFKYFE
jgi:Cu2+-containing amine oxidase